MDSSGVNWRLRIPLFALLFAGWVSLETARRELSGLVSALLGSPWAEMLSRALAIGYAAILAAVCWLGYRIWLRTKPARSTEAAHSGANWPLRISGLVLLWAGWVVLESARVVLLVRLLTGKTGTLGDNLAPVLGLMYFAILGSACALGFVIWRKTARG